MFQKILVALDQSDMSQQVFEQALVLAKATNASLMLVHVLSPIDQGYPSPVYPGAYSIYPTLNAEIVKEYMKEWEKSQQKGLEFLRSLADQATAAGVQTEFTQGLSNPSRTICELAQTWGADLIMMGRRGHIGVKEMVLGSVSNFVLHHAACSVLVVQGQLKVSRQIDQVEQVDQAAVVGSAKR
ncbi:MAG: universal stress protein [Aphanocapsa sp. GSE-SYN-MK-11-07L]|nr:universal stress protein [Aphanocapsa sp. GSE-SYN-MK-11-07L]